MKYRAKLKSNAILRTAAAAPKGFEESDWGEGDTWKETRQMRRKRERDEAKALRRQSTAYAESQKRKYR